MENRQTASDDRGRLNLLVNRLWRGRWLWLTFLAGALVILFLFRGGDLASFLPGHDTGDSVASSPAETMANTQALEETSRHRSRQVRQRSEEVASAAPGRTPRTDQAIAPDIERMDRDSPETLESAWPDHRDRSVGEPGGDRDGDRDDTGVTISGSVLDDDGIPIPGIQVDGRAMEAGQLDPASQITDRLGMFRFDSLERGEYALSVAESQDFYSAHVQVRAGSASVEIHLQPKRSVTVYGLVHDDAGMPLSDVLVRLLGAAETRSAHDGAYRISGPHAKAGQLPVVEFRHPDYRVQRHAVRGSDLRAGSDVQLDVTLELREESAMVHGQISGPSGEPVGNARVWVSSSRPLVHRQTHSDDSGHYVLDRLEPGGHFLLGVAPPQGYSTWVSRPLAIPAGSSRHDIEVERDDQGALFGSVISPQGRPLERFALWARTISPVGRNPVAVVTDDSGNFWIPELLAGQVQLESRSLPRLEARGIQIEPGQEHQIVVPMDWGESWLFGSVVNEHGEAIAGATLSLQWGEQYPDLYSTSVRQARSDLDGQFVFSNLGATHYELVARADGYVATRLHQVPAGHGIEEVLVVLEPVTRTGGAQ